MTEEQNDQSPQGPVSDADPETAPVGVPETTSQAAIPLPAVSPPSAEQPLPLPQQVDTPPMGVRKGFRSGHRLDTAPGDVRHGRTCRQPDARCRPASSFGGPPPPIPAPPCGRPRRCPPPRPAPATTSCAMGCSPAPLPLPSSVPASASAMQRRTTTAAAPRPSTRHRAARKCRQAPGLSGPWLLGESLRQRLAVRQPVRRILRELGELGQRRSGSSNSSGPSDADAIASKVDPGLVDINTTLGYQQEQAAGTGIVLSSNGIILTNNHVIDGATSISVTDIGNKKTYTASVVGYDRTKDIAVLQLHNASGLRRRPWATRPMPRSARMSWASATPAGPVGPRARPAAP